MDGDDFAEDAEFIDTDEDVGPDLILGYPATNVKAGGTLFFVLFLVLSLVFSSIGFYPGVGQVNLQVIPLGSDNDLALAGTLDDDITFKVFITAPILGWRSVDEVIYEISFNGKVRTTGSSEYNEARSGEGSKIKVDISDFFVDNGDYEITVTAGGKSDSDTIYITRNGKSVEGEMNFQGVVSNIVGNFNDEPTITLRFTDSSLSDPSAIRVSPQGYGYMDIFYVEHENHQTHSNDEYDSCYWNDDGCGPSRSGEDFVQRIYFNISRDSYSWHAAGEPDDDNSGFGQDYTIDLVPNDLRQNKDSDFTINVYFTNTFADDFCDNLSNTSCDSDLDHNMYEGRSNWDWFLLEA